MIKHMRIRAAGASDVQAVSQVLRSCGLTGSDIDPSARLYSLGLLGEKVIGCACGEKYGETVIIQAVAVRSEYRGTSVIRTTSIGARCNWESLPRAPRLSLLQRWTQHCAEASSIGGPEGPLVFGRAPVGLGCKSTLAPPTQPQQNHELTLRDTCARAAPSPTNARFST